MDLFIDGNMLYLTPMYALATVPLIKLLDHGMPVHQVWYADDASSVGKIVDVPRWWNNICLRGQAFSYFTNANKTWLITTQVHHSNATSAFAEMNVNVTIEGRPHLGAAIGTTEFRRYYIIDEVKEWSNEIETLMSTAKFQAHEVYAAFTHGLMSRWSYLPRTTRDTSPHLLSLEDKICTSFVPALIV